MYKFFLFVIIILIVGGLSFYFYSNRPVKVPGPENPDIPKNEVVDNSVVWSTYTQEQLLGQLSNEPWYTENKDMFRIIKLEDHFLILDSGTAPEPRTLTIYDLDNRMKVYSGLYSSPVEVSSTSVKFWSPTDLSNSKDPVTPTESNCPDMKKYTDMGLGVGIEKLSEFNLDKLTFVSSDTIRCSVRQ